MSRHVDSQLFASLVGRLRQSDMTEEDLRECSSSIQRQILFDLGYDTVAVAALQELLHTRAANHSPAMLRRRIAGGSSSSSPPMLLGAEGASSLLGSGFFARHPGSVEYAEVEQAVGAEFQASELGASLAVEVRAVSAIPPGTVAAAEREFRTLRLDSGAQPERLFRFVGRRQADAVAASCNIFDSCVEGGWDDLAVSRNGQVIGRALVSDFSPADLARFAETSNVVVGVDALVTKPIAMREGQFAEWCRSLSDSAEASAALAEHGATCVQVECGGGGSRLYIFDSRIAIMRVIAVVAVVRDAYHCAPGAVASRGCPKHGNRKFEFWSQNEKRLLCGLCLYFEPGLRDQCIVIDEAFSNEMPRVQQLRERVKARQGAVASTLSRIDAMHDSFADRVAHLRDHIEDAFTEIRRLVDLQEADTMSVFEMAVRSNQDALQEASDLFRRFEGDATSFLEDATAALQMRDPARVLGVAQLAESSDGGSRLDLGNEAQHGRVLDLPSLQFDRHAVLAALQKAVVLAGGTLSAAGGGSGNGGDENGSGEDKLFDL